MRLLPFIALALASGTANAAEPLVLDAAELRVRDIAAVARGGDAVLLRLPARARTVLLDEERRARLVRNRLPGVTFSLHHSGPLTVARGARTRTAARCLVTRSDMPAGTYILAEDVTSEPCADDRPRALVGYDRATGAVFARGHVPAGSRIGDIALPAAAPIAAGSERVLEFAEGPVVIQREVRTLQSARPGRRVFLKTEDGEVIAANVAESREIEP